jgi:hypothetical protein
MPSRISSRPPFLRAAAALLLTGVAATLVVGPLLPVWGQTPTAPATSAPATGSDSALRPVFEALRAGRADLAAKMLKATSPASLTESDARRYQQYAVQAALRTGDRAWLEALNDDGAKASRATDQLMLTIRRFLEAADYKSARVLLESVESPEELSEVARRRYLQLYARLEQLTGNHARERAYVAKLVDFVGQWGESQCQACHADPKKFGTAVTTLDVSHWWAGERLSRLLAQHGDAAKVLADARQRMAANPADGAARLRAAFALRALGRDAEAESLLRHLEWAEFPDRERRAPMQFAPFP